MKKYDVRLLGETENDWWEAIGSDIYEALEKDACQEYNISSHTTFEVRNKGSRDIYKIFVKAWATYTYDAVDYKETQ